MFNLFRKMSRSRRSSLNNEIFFEHNVIVVLHYVKCRSLGPKTYTRKYIIINGQLFNNIFLLDYWFIEQLVYVIRYQLHIYIYIYYQQKIISINNRKQVLQWIARPYYYTLRQLVNSYNRPSVITNFRRLAQNIITVLNNIRAKRREGRL